MLQIIDFIVTTSAAAVAAQHGTVWHKNDCCFVVAVVLVTLASRIHEYIHSCIWLHLHGNRTAGNWHSALIVRCVVQLHALTAGTDGLHGVLREVFVEYVQYFNSIAAPRSRLKVGRKYFGCGWQIQAFHTSRVAIRDKIGP